MQKSTSISIIGLSLLLFLLIASLHAFAPPLSCSSGAATDGITTCSSISSAAYRHHRRRHLHYLEQPLHQSAYSLTLLGMKIDQKRRKQLGISDDEDEYDLDRALSANTDAGITKIIAGSFILVMIALLVVGLVWVTTWYVISLWMVQLLFICSYCSSLFTCDIILYCIGRIPSITDYGEGVCSPIQNGGRC